jgi:hypothetical protein
VKRFAVSRETSNVMSSLDFRMTCSCDIREKRVPKRQRGTRNMWAAHIDRRSSKRSHHAKRSKERRNEEKKKIKSSCFEKLDIVSAIKTKGHYKRNGRTYHYCILCKCNCMWKWTFATFLSRLTSSWRKLIWRRLPSDRDEWRKVGKGERTSNNHFTHDGATSLVLYDKLQSNRTISIILLLIQVVYFIICLLKFRVNFSQPLATPWKLAMPTVDLRPQRRNIESTVHELRVDKHSMEFAELIDLLKLPVQPMCLTSKNGRWTVS